MTCFIWGAKTTEINDLKICLIKKVEKKNFEFSLSPLHSYILFLGIFLNISYQLETKM